MTVFPAAVAVNVVMVDVPPMFSVAFTPLVSALPPLNPVVTVRFPLFVVVELIARLPSEPVPLIVCPPVVCIVTVTVVLVVSAFIVRFPVVVSTPATTPVMLPPELTVIPPMPIFVVRGGFAHAAVPMIVNEFAAPGLPFMVTVWPAHICTSSAAVGVAPAETPPHEALDQVLLLVQFPFCRE